MVVAAAGAARGVGVCVASTAGVACGVGVGVVGWVSWVAAVAGVATAVSRLGWELLISAC
jgi:hypothetical protein